MLSQPKIENRQGTGLLLRELLEDCGRRHAPATVKLVSGDSISISSGIEVKITETAVAWKEGNGDHWFVPFSAIVTIMGSPRPSRSVGGQRGSGVHPIRPKSNVGNS